MKEALFDQIRVPQEKETIWKALEVVNRLKAENEVLRARIRELEEELAQPVRMATHSKAVPYA